MEVRIVDIAIPRGYFFAGGHCGIKESGRPDLACVVFDPPAAAAGVFTQNRVTAAPVHVSRRRLPATDVRGLVVNSGNANACTGGQGLRDAEQMTATLAKHLRCDPEKTVVASTGVIGVRLPMDRITAGIVAIAKEAGTSRGHVERAAEGILTTDTVTKISWRSLKSNGSEVSVLGIAKGAAMIAPNMATMLAFVFTDARMSAESLHDLARTAADRTFNRITVEGHTSTNDTLMLFANGAAPSPDIEQPLLADAVVEVCADLAKAIAADAEGASHLIRIEVVGAASEADARRIAKTVAESALVKTAIFGADPNWGRIVSAAGYAGVPFDEENLSLYLGEYLLYAHGKPLPCDLDAASAYLRENREVTIRLQFDLGSAECSFWTCDLTYEYIRLNAEYTT